MYTCVVYFGFDPLRSISTRPGESGMERRIYVYIYLSISFYLSIYVYMYPPTPTLAQVIAFATPPDKLSHLRSNIDIYFPTYLSMGLPEKYVYGISGLTPLRFVCK